MAFAGVVLLMIALLSAYIRDMPITTSALYLGLGVLISPLGLNLIEINFIEQSEVFEYLTEIAVMVALFLGGLKLRLPFRDPAWSAAYRLAGPVMVASICGIAVFSHFAFGIGWPLVCLFSLAVAATMGQVASAFPTAGGLYHWASILGGKGWGWATAWYR